ncbi:alpha/beta hydrolase [Niveispirillum sp.]|uniref:alpha/beta fold hydrolase n=1 Tax=Niveispirillum sp. TaxID=1917217 RepID=UPI001B5FCF24|nr:alpha/beta hydrolase [Niveispirillum sp.]MBP7338408.1 alpha/beta hydrolase [Niveispirillum sp.]
MPTVRANGIDIAYRDEGHGPALLLCHGWPELGHSWRHQVPALVAAGYRVIVPDMRGFGDTEAPEAVEDYTILHLVGDMVGLLDALGIERCVIVGHDWGAPVAWHAALMRPDRFRAVAGLAIPWSPRGPHGSLIGMARAQGMERFYMVWFQEPGVAEADLEADPAETHRRLLVGASGAAEKAGRGWPLVIPDGMGLVGASHPVPVLPDWLSEQDLAVYAATYRRTGYRGGLNWYRNLDRNWALTAPLTGARIQVPACFIAGAEDGVLRMPGMAKAVRAMDGMTCTDFRGTTLIDGAGHWVQQEAPEAVNRALLRFLGTLCRNGHWR